MFGFLKQKDDMLVKIVEERIGSLVGFYGISTIVGYLTPNPFSCK